MRERPILFSGPMVRAILEGKKTQTRRLVALKKVKHRVDWVGWSEGLDDGSSGWAAQAVWPGSFDCPAELDAETSLTCQYGEAGDRLWVRETFTIENCYETGFYEPPHHDGRPVCTYSEPGGETWWEQPHYRATDPEPQLVIPNSPDPGCIWSPSIFMPRWASRLTLEIEFVRVERLQEITTADCLAEGVPQTAGEASALGLLDLSCTYGHEWDNRTSVENYALLWDKLNGKIASFKRNPWVWVIGFRRLA